MARLTIGGGLLAAAALSGVFSILAPASAQAVVRQLVSFTCADPQSCITITNTSHKGQAIVGVAQDNAGIVGRTSINTNRDPNPINPFLVTNGGIWGIDTSTNHLDTNAGVLGTSHNGSGVIGVTTFDSSVNQFGQSGVGGYDLGNKPGGNSVGVWGQSNYSTGVFGLGVNSIGVEGAAQNGGLGVIGDTADTASAPGVGVLALSNFGNALLANSSSSTGGMATLVSTNFGGGDPIQAWSCNCNGNASLIMRIDTAGNETLAGTLTQNGIPMSVSPTSTGAKVLTFAAQQSTRTVEDVGEGRLDHGQAYVSFDRTFASAIDGRRSYLVFITPQGDSNGLYVAQKSANGFIVREHSGVSNIAFDYRIVAQPFGSSAQRLPAYVAPYAARGGAYRSMVKRVLALKRVHRPRYQQDRRQA